MGNGQAYYLGFDRTQKYTTLRSETVNGVKGTLIKQVSDASGTHSNLPEYANTSNVYFRQNVNGVCQARVYIDRKVCIDFDWSHDHTNRTDGRRFPRGVVHVQIWKFHPNGTKERISDGARYMNNNEIKKYGQLIKTFCPNVKFRN